MTKASLGVICKLKTIHPPCVTDNRNYRDFDDPFSLCYGQYESQNIKTVYRLLLWSTEITECIDEAGRGTALQAGMSRVLFPMIRLYFTHYIINPKTKL